MAQYRVKPGFRFGAYDQHEPGTVVELTEAEAAGFRDKLEPIKAEAENLTQSRKVAKAEEGDEGLRLEDGGGDVGVFIEDGGDKTPIPEPEPEPEPSTPRKKRG